MLVLYFYFFENKPKCQHFKASKDIHNTRTSLPNPKSKIRIGCWNVRTIFETGKTAQVAKKMTEYRVNILEVAECRWTNKGRLKLAEGTTVQAKKMDIVKQEWLLCLIT